MLNYSDTTQASRPRDAKLRGMTDILAAPLPVVALLELSFGNAIASRTCRLSLAFKAAVVNLVADSGTPCLPSSA